MQRRLRAAWALGDAERATAELEQLARSLDRQRPGAAASLREGLEQTLTVTRLGIGGKLLQTVESTNPHRVDGLDHPRPRRPGEPLELRRDGAALGRRRDGRGRQAIPPRQRLPAPEAA